MRNLRKTFFSLILVIAMAFGCAPRNEVNAEFDIHSEDYQRLSETFSHEALEYCYQRGIDPNLINIEEGNHSYAEVIHDNWMHYIITKIVVAQSAIYSGVGDSVLKKECNTPEVINDLRENNQTFNNNNQLHLYIDMQALFMLPQEEQEIILKYATGRDYIITPRYIPWPNTTCATIEFGKSLARQGMLLPYEEAGEELLELRGCK